MPDPTHPEPCGEEFARGLERLLLDLAVRLINVPGDELDGVLAEALAAVGSYADVDRITVIRYDWDAGTASATHEWCAPGIEPLIDGLQFLPYNTIWPEHAEQHRQGRQTYLPDVSALPASPFRELLLTGGTHSLIDTPLIDEGQCLGVVSLETVGRPVCWSQPHQEVLRVLAQLLINIEHRRHHDQTVRQLNRVNAINAELESFAGVVAHDLQQPLASSLGLLALVRSGRLPAEQQDALLVRAEVRLQQMSRLIDRLLRYASSGRVLGTLRPVDLDEVVDEATEGCRQLIADRGVRLHRTGLPGVYGDHARLVEVVTNLLTNAIRHTPTAQDPQIWIAGSEHDHLVALTVADDGPGIRPKDRERVLAPFDRLDGASPAPGTGLGLPIVASIVEAHGGQLELATSGAGGLLVRILLPRSAASAAGQPA